MLIMRICVITYSCKSGGGTWDTTLYTVRGVSSGSRDDDVWSANGSVRRGSGAPSTDGLEHGGVSLGRMAY